MLYNHIKRIHRNTHGFFLFKIFLVSLFSDVLLSIISKEHHERFENMMGLIYDMNHEQNYSYYRAGIKLAAEIFLEAFKDEE